MGRPRGIEHDVGASEVGFTLIELLIVIVVIGILAGIVSFAVGAFRSDASNAACRTDVRAIATANDAYIVGHGSSAPDIDALIAAGYLKSAPKSGVTFANGVTTPASIDGCSGELAFTPDPTTTSTSTSTSTSTPASNPTLSVSAGGSTVHGAVNTPDFTATVTVTVTDQNHVVVAGAVVAGTWDDGHTPAGCTTGGAGSCSFDSPHSTDQPNVAVTWHLSSVTKSGYDQAAGSVALACSRRNDDGGVQQCT